MARFRSPLRRQRPRTGLASWWPLWRMPVLLIIVMSVWWFGFRPVASDEGWVRVTETFAICGQGGARQPGCVVDGDTVIIGYGPSRRRIRLTGFDAPELEGACEAESTQARRSQRRLHQWLSEGPFEWDGGASPPRDQYGRELRAVRRVTGNGARDASAQYLADIMIAEDLAAETGWGTFERDWCS